MTQMYRMRRKFQRGLCPYDDTIAELKGGLQHAPKWLRSLRKYPPTKMWLTPGALARPSEFFGDEIRKMMLKNRRRPDWIPSLFANSPSTSQIMSGAQFQDTFDTATFGMDSDIEFTACQAWFMQKRNMSEEEAYVQARFKMRDLVKQKKRVWEVYRRTQFLTEEQRKNEDISVTDGWIKEIKSQMEKNAMQIVERQHIIKQQMKHKPQSLIDTSSIDSSRLSSSLTKKDEYEEQVKDEIAFDREWEQNLKLLRFIEYSDYISKNPHLGISDPTQLLSGIPTNTQRLKEIKKRLLIKMSNRDRRTIAQIQRQRKYITKNLNPKTAEN